MTKPKWDIPDKTRVNINDTWEPLATDGAKAVERDVMWKRSRPHGVNYPIVSNYWGGLNYKGLRIHTHPWKWRAIPLPFPSRPYQRNHTLYIHYTTVDSSLRGTNLRTSPGGMGSNPGGDVEVTITRGYYPPSLVTGWPADRPPPEGRVWVLNGVEGVAKISTGLAYPGVKYTAPGGEPEMFYLWIRSTVGARTDLGEDAAKLSGEGWYVMSSEVNRRSALEAPLVWNEGPNHRPAAPLWGRLLKTEYVADHMSHDGVEDVVVLERVRGYSQHYFVEYEGWSYRDDPDRIPNPVRTYHRFSYPTFPRGLLTQARTSGAFESEQEHPIGVVSVDTIYETTGIIIHSLYLEQEGD